MIYRIFHENKLVSTEYTLPAVSKYLLDNHPQPRGTGVRTIKSKMVNGVFTKGTYRVEKVQYTEGIKKRVIPKQIRDIRIIEDNNIITKLKWGKSKLLSWSNYNDIAKMITEKIKEKGNQFLLTHKIKVAFLSKKYTEYEKVEYVFGTKFLDFNSLYEDIIGKFKNILEQYNVGEVNIMKIAIRYIQVPLLNNVYIYKGEQKDENKVMDDIINRMKINNKEILLKTLNKFYIWSPSTNKNCCIQACFMAKYQRRDVKENTKDFLKKHNKDKDIIYNLETLCPLLKVTLKRNIKVICIDTKIQEYTYRFSKDANTLNIMVKGGHTYALIPKKDFNDDYEEPDNELDNQYKIEKPEYKNDLYDYTIAVYDLETCNSEEKKEDKNDTTVYALGYYNGDDYKEIYKTEKDKDKNILLKFLYYLKYNEQGNKIIYAHNGGKFDTYLLLKEILKSNLFTVTSYLDSNGRILNMTIVENKKYKPKKYVFRDSINLIAGSLDGACKSFKPTTKKLEGDVNHDLININNCYTKKIYDYTKEYLKCDCLSLYEILDIFDKTISKAYKFGIKDVMTNASIARRVFLDKHYDEENKPLYTLDRETDRELRKYYFGGRNECMGKLGHTKGKFYYVDFTSLYPSVMMKYDYFYGEMKKIKLPENTTKFNDKWFGFVKVMFRHKNKKNIPYHAVAKDGKLIFPYVDNWAESIISTEDIRYSLKNKLGYEYKFIEVFNWENKGQYFKPIVDELYKMKIQAQNDGNKALRSIAKIIINSLYGFFGINFLERNQTKIINERCGKTKTVEDSRSCRFYGFLLDQKLKDYKSYGKYDIYQIEDTIKAKCANVGIASMVTSYARTELYKLLKAIKDKKGNIYYMDTDSVITDYNIYDDKDFKKFIGSGGDKLGELTNEALDEYEDEIKGLYIKKIKKDNPNIKDMEKIDKIYKKLYKKKVEKYMVDTYKKKCGKQYKPKTKEEKESPHYKEIITLGNKMYALNTDFKYDFEGEEVILKTKTIKMKGLNSKQKYDEKIIDHNNKTIEFKTINRFDGKEKIDFDIYKYLANDYIVICDNMNFISGTKEMLIKDKGLTKINNTKQIKQLYDKATVDWEGDKSITPLVI